MTDMQYRPVGRSGLMVSVVGLGANNFGRRVDLDQSRAVIDAALSEGINFIDTADIYGGLGGSEEIIGSVLEGRRDQVVIGTKFGGDMGGAYGPDWGARGGRRYIRRAVEGSLRRLRTDHLDLYQYHAPDGITPIEETLAAVHELVQEGKVRYIGSSNLGAWEAAHADWVSRDRLLTPFISAQNHFNLLQRAPDLELLPACQRFGVAMIPYFPLASGLLTGKYRRGAPPPKGSRLAGRPERLTDDVFDKLEQLEKFAADRGVTILDVAIGWLAARPQVASVIAGATRPEQVRANAAAASWIPTDEDLAAIDRIVPPPAEP
jgi:aryl-alcohol dehydrogenase-like predicted oxidoreductase